jgi:hypothetical protein
MLPSRSLTVARTGARLLLADPATGSEQPVPGLAVLLALLGTLGVLIEDGLASADAIDVVNCAAMFTSAM